MGFLRSIEARIEGVFEGIFGRAFRTNVQPIELARKLVKEMDDHRSVSVSRVYVPNEYTLYLSPADRRQFAAYEASLITELQEYLAEHARREQYALVGTPRVLITEDADLAVGEFGIATRVTGDRSAAAPPEPAHAPVPAPPEPPAATIVYAPPVVPPEPETEPEPEPEPRSYALLIEGQEHVVTGERAVLGRSRECEVRLADVNVSRRHAEVREDGEGYELVDLGSTNGTLLNGERIHREPLADGDVITLGSTDIVFTIRP